MDKTYFTNLVAYNLSTTNTVCSWLEQISDEQWTMPIDSSFDSIQKTVLHVATAEKAWVERLNNVNNAVPLGKNFTGTKTELLNIWKETSEKLVIFINECDVSKIDEQFSFERFNGDTHTSKYYQVIFHVLIHAAYHRGQLVTMLRQVGFTNVQATDIIGYYLTQKE